LPVGLLGADGIDHGMFHGISNSRISCQFYGQKFPKQKVSKRVHVKGKQVLMQNGGKIEKFCVQNPNTEMANFTAKLS
jgi:hypothetical protein